MELEIMELIEHYRSEHMIGSYDFLEWLIIQDVIWKLESILEGLK